MKTIRPDFMRSALALLLLLSFQLALLALFRWQVPAENRDMVIYILGQLSGMVTSAIAYYFGTSRTSVDKQAVIESYNASAASADADPGAATDAEKA